MKNQLPFNIPFCGFCGTTFINCFTSAFMYLRGIDVGGYDYDCVQRQGVSCNSCGNCGHGGSTPIAVQEKYFFLFDTLCGRSSLRCRFDGRPTDMQRMICETDFDDGGTDDNIDFLFGLAGYDHRHATDAGAWLADITVAIDAGKPVLAKVKDGDERFRVLTGYDGDALICPDFTNAQQKPEAAPCLGDIEALYLFGEKTAPRFTVLDGLRRIRQVMTYNAREDLWGGYIEKMGLYTNDSLGRCGIEEKKTRMKRVTETMWHTFNCHNFAEVFRQYLKGNAAVYDGIADMSSLKHPAFQPLWQRISGPGYGCTHDLAWALIGLEECVDWSRHAAGYFGEMVELTLSRIAQNDADVLDAIEQAMAILENTAEA